MRGVSASYALCLNLQRQVKQIITPLIFLFQKIQKVPCNFWTCDVSSRQLSEIGFSSGGKCRSNAFSDCLGESIASKFG